MSLIDHVRILPLAADDYAANGMITSASGCTACPPGTYGPKPAHMPPLWPAECEPCRAGELNWRSRQAECVACPTEGIFCNNQTSIDVWPGFYRPEDDDSPFAFPCPMGADACAGGSIPGEASCLPGYRGPLCGMCTGGNSSSARFYRSSEQCMPCPAERDGVAFAASTCVLLSFLWVWFFHARVTGIDLVWLLATRSRRGCLSVCASGHARLRPKEVALLKEHAVQGSSSPSDAVGGLQRVMAVQQQQWQEPAGLQSAAQLAEASTRPHSACSRAAQHCWKWFAHQCALLWAGVWALCQWVMHIVHYSMDYSLLATLAKIVLFYGQALSPFQRYEYVAWPRIFLTVLHRLTGFLDLNISIYPLECQGHDYAIRLAFLTSLPVVISAACLLLSWFALRFLPCPAEGREALLSKKSVATVVWLHTWLLLILLPVLSREYLNHLSCTAYRDPGTGQVVKLLVRPCKLTAVILS